MKVSVSTVFSLLTSTIVIQVVNSFTCVSDGSYPDPLDPCSPKYHICSGGQHSAGNCGVDRAYFPPSDNCTELKNLPHSSKETCRGFVKVEGQKIASSSNVLNGYAGDSKHSYTLGSWAVVNNCGALCVKNAACLSFTFRQSDGYCQLSSLTPGNGMTGYTASAGSDVYYR